MLTAGLGWAPSPAPWLGSSAGHSTLLSKGLGSSGIPTGTAEGVSPSLSHCHTPRSVTPPPPGGPGLRWAGAGCPAGRSRWTGWRGAPRGRRPHRPRGTAPAPRGPCHPELPAAACKAPVQSPLLPLPVLKQNLTPSDRERHFRDCSVTQFILYPLISLFPLREANTGH